MPVSKEDKVLDPPGTGVIGGYESPEVGARTQTWVLWNNNLCP